MQIFVFVHQAYFTGGADKPQKDEEFVIEALKVDPVYFHICGISQASVDAAKQKINDLFSKQHTRHNITEKAILSFSEAERRCITEIQKTWSVSIMAKSKQGEISFTIEGLSNDVLKATTEIHKILRKARDEEDLKVKVELAGRVAAWQYMKGSQFENLDSVTNYELEQALVKNLPSVKVTIQGQLYTVQMPNGPATDNQGHALQIRRNDNLKGILPVSYEVTRESLANQIIGVSTTVCSHMHTTEESPHQICSKIAGDTPNGLG